MKNDNDIIIKNKTIFSDDGDDDKNIIKRTNDSDEDNININKVTNNLDYADMYINM